MLTGKQRRQRIRAMSREPIHRLKARCAERRSRYRRMKSLNAPEVILELYFSSWHDAEYALSIQEGFYDPTSPINKFVCRHLAKKGIEVTPEELAVFRRSTLAHLLPFCLKCSIPPEYGCIIRYTRPLETPTAG